VFQATALRYTAGGMHHGAKPRENWFHQVRAAQVLRHRQRRGRCAVGPRQRSCPSAHRLGLEAVFGNPRIQRGRLHRNIFTTLCSAAPWPVWLILTLLKQPVYKPRETSHSGETSPPEALPPAPTAPPRPGKEKLLCMCIEAMLDPDMVLISICWGEGAPPEKKKKKNALFFFCCPFGGAKKKKLGAAGRMRSRHLELPRLLGSTLLQAGLRLSERKYFLAPHAQAHLAVVLGSNRHSTLVKHVAVDQRIQIVRTRTIR